MKKKSLLLLLAAAVPCASIFYASTRALHAQNIAAASASAAPATAFPSVVSIDPITFEVIAPDGFQDAVAELNTAETREQRRIASWAIRDPEDFKLHNPISPEQMAAARQASLMMTVPIASPPSEADQKAYDAILHPTQSTIHP